ncbi:AraC family transcriptional regulator [Bradyrhizobium genosp. SA-3]
MGLSPHAWLRQHRLDEATTMLCDPNTVAPVAVAPGCAFTAFGAQTIDR